jgi:hypothetical protein
MLGIAALLQPLTEMLDNDNHEMRAKLLEAGGGPAAVPSCCAVHIMCVLAGHEGLALRPQVQHLAAVCARFGPTLARRLTPLQLRAGAGP